MMPSSERPSMLKQDACFSQVGFPKFFAFQGQGVAALADLKLR